MVLKFKRELEATCGDPTCLETKPALKSVGGCGVEVVLLDLVASMSMRSDLFLLHLFFPQDSYNLFPLILEQGEPDQQTTIRGKR